jgi:hypothetical protein
VTADHHELVFSSHVGGGGDHMFELRATHGTQPISASSLRRSGSLSIPANGEL